MKIRRVGARTPAGFGFDLAAGAAGQTNRASERRYARRRAEKYSLSGLLSFVLQTSML
jgi:hypothetical protein